MDQEVSVHIDSAMGLIPALKDSLGLGIQYPFHFPGSLPTSLTARRVTWCVYDIRSHSLSLCSITEVGKVEYCRHIEQTTGICHDGEVFSFKKL